MYPVLSAFAIVVTVLSTFGSAAYTPRDATFAWRRLPSASCTPAFAEGALYNVFQAGEAARAWEYLPPARNRSAIQGGAVYVSETDTPENGAWYISETEGGNGTFTMSLGSQDAGVQCLRSVGKNGGVTTGHCGLAKSLFTISCLSCPRTTPSSTGDIAGRACTITSSVASPGYCVTSVFPSSHNASDSPGLAALKITRCGTRLNRRQAWDVVLA